MGEYTAPLSPLTLLSQRLAQRMKGSRSTTISPPPTPDLSALEATWRQAAATQTSCTSSTATLRSPLLPPTRQQFSPRASTHFYTAPSSPILVTPVPHRRINEEQERKRREEEEEAKQRVEEVRMRKLKKVLAKEEKERQVWREGGGGQAGGRAVEERAVQPVHQVQGEAGWQDQG